MARYLPSEDEYYMSLALAEAKKAYDFSEVPIGAIVVYKHRVIATAYNCVESAGDPTAHAEVLAIQRASFYLKNWRLGDCVLYSTLEPCLMCMGAILHSRISRLVYAAYEPKFGFESAYDIVRSQEAVLHPSLYSQIEIERGVYCRQSQKLLNDFFQKRRSF